MIQVDRDRDDARGRPIRPDDAWFKKALAATDEVKASAQELLSADEPAEPPLADLQFKADRGVYADTQVKIALKEMFHQKCAYCESKLAANGPWDVEHYRPKGRVKEAPEHPGYYWLAYDWDNLYPSCPGCNRRYRDQPTWHRPSFGPAAGKADSFPLADETQRAMSHLEDVGLEEPELIDPCSQSPDSYLTFVRNGAAVSIGDNSKGYATIDVLHLNREDLREARQARIQEVLDNIGNIHKALPSPADAPQRSAALKRLAQVYFRPTSLYSAACRAIWRSPLAFGLSDDLPDPDHPE